MSTNRDFNRLAAAWLAEGPSELADRVLDAALDEVHLTHQRRRITVPWRLPSMNTPLRLVAAIAIVAVVGYASLTFFNPNGGTGSTPTPTPTPALTQGTATQSPTPSPTPTAPPSSFTSPIYGYTIDLPAGWTSIAARTAWDGTSPVNYDSAEADQFESASGTPAWVYAAPTTKSVEELSADLTASDAIHHPCGPTPEVDEPTTIDGAPARMTVKHCEPVGGILVANAVVIRDGIGYVFYLQHPPEDTADPEDVTVFATLLSRVHLP